MNHYFFIYKPYQVLSQFTSESDKKCLKDFFAVPPQVYPVGRLDYDSEGLLILTDDKRLNHLLLDPANNHKREYLVQVEGKPSVEQISTLQSGVQISVNGKRYLTRKCKVSLVAHAPKIPDRFPPIRFRKNIPDSWISITLAEGKNRQVRKMTAAVGLPTLRLIRTRIESLTIMNMQPGDMVQTGKKDLYNLLGLNKQL